MNTVITSREAILEKSREIISIQGLAALNICSVASACGVSVGSIYNYFHSKSDLTASAVEDVWHDIFHFQERAEDFACFPDCLKWIFGCMKNGSEKYPGFFTFHSMSFLGEEKEDGQRLMAQSWLHIQNVLIRVLENDQSVRPDAFGETLTRQEFVDIIFSFIISALVRRNYDSRAILEMVRRAIY